MPQISIVTADVSQVFETCSSGEVVSSSALFSAEFLKATGSNCIQVLKGKRCVFKPGAKLFGGNAFTFPTNLVAAALAAYTLLTLVVYGNLVFEMSGLAMGGVASGVCVLIFLGASEVKWLVNTAEQE